ncbi:MAG: 16S rRNA (uracil(1498)-N(3))-methyltransferase [Cellvibrio sp.]|nr:16S rRNA (uracil(1498)-N(3))-methyltransferase [Cellvibrio sp.]
MRIPRIYIDQALAITDSVLLNENASHYLSKVLRMQEGRELIVFNGQGGEYSAQIKEIGKKQIAIQISQFSEGNRQSPLELHLAIGISRGERMDWVLQKATELGVTQIIPLITERTEVKIKGEKQDKKMQHWQQIIISACEQCQRNLLPILQEPQAIDSWLKTVSTDYRFVLHHRNDQSLSESSAPKSVTLLIGPEGGLSEEEIILAENEKFQSLRLGPRVLRTETAPVAAISLVQYLWGDLGE